MPYRSRHAPALSLDDFSYALPPLLVAQRPPPHRDGGRLMDLRGTAPAARRLTSLPRLLQAGDLLVVNDSRVLPARLCGRKESGGRAEIFAERFIGTYDVLAQIRASRPPAAGERLFAGGAFVVREKTSAGFYLLRAVSRGGRPVNARARFMRRGAVPLPPYIQRPPDAADQCRYQTVFARHAGSVAAPTAGLHFTPSLLAALAARDIAVTRITLHVGAGTFLPLRRGLSASRLHAERYVVSATAAARINAAKSCGRRIVAVGTTVLRALESAATGGVVCAAAGETDLFIKPGFRFQIADMLLTNFHLPRSSLLVLTCAFGGRQRVLAAYRRAVAQKFRFYSYGDAMLLARA